MIEHFEGEAYREPAVQRLLARVHAAPYGTDRFAADNHFGAEVKVLMRDGATFSEKVDQPFGRTSDNPLTPELLKEKFENCSARALDAGAIARIYAAVQSFDTLDDMRVVTALACGGPVREARRAAGA
jgi:2-methylcitrate dehydratase PrpD